MPVQSWVVGIVMAAVMGIEIKPRGIDGRSNPAFLGLEIPQSVRSKALV